MGKIKELILDHKGYVISGVVLVRHWGGSKGYLAMNPVFIPTDKLSHTAIKHAVNDGQFGVEDILEAEINISDAYGPTHLEVHNRKMTLNSKQCFYGTRGIIR